jgi:hypothetical protein
MKKIIPFFLVLTCSKTFSQSVGIGTATPHSSALLEVNSTNKGLLMPRMTTAQRTTITSPAKGLMIFDTDLNALYIYDGTTWVSYKPQAGGALSLPYSANGSYNTAAINISNLHTTTTAPTLQVEALTGHAIQGTSSSNFYSGVYGENSGTGKGVSGLNTGAGHGVHARGTDGTALYADIPGGTGTAGKFKQTNVAGKALEVEGNVKISGGNTNPGAGKVLTSDAAGNATWQDPNPNGRIGFSVRGIMGNGANVIARATPSKIHFEFEEADFGNNYNASLNAPSSTFTVPVTGLYHLSAAVTVADSQADVRNCWIQIVGFTNTRETLQESLKEGEIPYQHTLHTEGDFMLQAGQKVWVEFVVNTFDNSTTVLERSKSYSHFSCHLLIPQ